MALQTIDATPTDTPAFEVIPPLRQDLSAFGFETFKQYRDWCACNDLVDGLKKGRGARLLAFIGGPDRSQRPVPPLTRERQYFLEQIVTNRYPYSRWQTRAIEESIGDDAATQRALLRLLLHVDRYMPVMRSKKLYRTGTHKEFMHGLLALAHHHHRWLRPLEEWQCEPCIDGHPRPSDQFGSLLRHLLARYHVPNFMDIAFFEGGDERGLQLQEWFIHVANGGNIRDFDAPIELTKRMAHLLLSMPGQYRDNIERSMRRAQVMGMGGDAQLVETILRTRIGRNFDDDTFWSTVVLFLANNAMMDPGCVGPLIDYVYNMKFAPRRIVRAEGGVEEAPPPHPDFTMKGRSAIKLLRQVDAWHGHLNREDNVLFQSWQPCGLRPYEMEEKTDELGSVRWTVQELLSSWELAAEGRAMSHCVVSYSNQCADGKTSIWSIAMQKQGQEQRENALTVAVDIKNRTITQARGRHNMLPNKQAKSNAEQQEANSGYAPMINGSAQILQRWMEREQLLRAD